MSGCASILLLISDSSSDERLTEKLHSLLLLSESNRVEEALEMTDRGLSLCEVIRGERHSETATWLNNTGELLLLQQRYRESCHFFSKAHSVFSEYTQSLFCLSISLP